MPTKAQYVEYYKEQIPRLKRVIEAYGKQNNYVQAERYQKELAKMQKSLARQTKRKNPVTSTSSAEGWIPCHAIRVVGNEIQMLTEGRVTNGIKSKFKKAVSKLKKALTNKGKRKC